MLLLVTAIPTVFAQDSGASAQTVRLQGQITDTAGTPAAGAVVEIWQADPNGNYNHPNDSQPSALLKDFQYFGTATANEEGYYAFLTLKPGAYATRPPHIHFKIKVGGVEVLTSQFYFAEDRQDVERDTTFGSAGETLFLQAADHPDATLTDSAVRIVTGNIVLDLNGSQPNTLTPTAAQPQGPYYPVVDFSSYDNNLLNAATDDEPVEPIPETGTSAFTLLNLNTASVEEFLTIPNMSNRMVREFNEYRPYVSISQFRREIGKYVDDATVAGYEAYVYVPININESDRATLMQIPGVDETTAQQLIAARPYADQAAFLTALRQLAPGADVDYAAHFLEAQ